MDSKLVRIGRIVRRHMTDMDEERAVLARVRDVADHKLWRPQGTSVMSHWLQQTNLSGDSGELAIRRQVNTVRPNLDRTKSALYARAPRLNVKLPVVRSEKAPKVPVEDLVALSEAATQWARSREVRRVMESAIEEAAGMPGAGLKFTFDEKRAGLHAVRIEVVTRWNIGWDVDAPCEDEESYRFHLRWVRIDQAKKLCPGLDPERDGRPIADWLTDGFAKSTEEGKTSDHVLIVEWWDLLEGTVQNLVVLDDSVGEFGSQSAPIPYKWPDGRPIIQIVPVILANSLGKERQPVSMALAWMEESCEKSYSLSAVLTMMRRDLARKLLVDGALDEAAVNKLLSPRDMEVVKITRPQGEMPRPLRDLVHALELPSMSASIDKAAQYLGAAAADNSTMSSLGRGQIAGLEYASGTAASALMSGDAAAASLPAERMGEYLTEIARAGLAILAQKQVGFVVTVAGKDHRVTPERLALEWEVVLDDAAVRRAQREAASTKLVQLLPLYNAAIAQATTSVGQDGKEIPKEARLAAQRIVDHIVDTLELPDSMRWESFVSAEPDVAVPDEFAKTAKLQTSVQVSQLKAAKAQADATVVQAEAVINPPEPEPAPAAPAPPAAEPAPAGAEDPLLNDPRVLALADTRTPEELAAPEQMLLGNNGGV